MLLSGKELADVDGDWQQGWVPVSASTGAPWPPVLPLIAYLSAPLIPLAWRAKTSRSLSTAAGCDPAMRPYHRDGITLAALPAARVPRLSRRGPDTIPHYREGGCIIGMATPTLRPALQSTITSSPLPRSDQRSSRMGAAISKRVSLTDSGPGSLRAIESRAPGLQLPAAGNSPTWEKKRRRSRKSRPPRGYEYDVSRRGPITTHRSRGCVRLCVLTLCTSTSGTWGIRKNVRNASTSPASGRRGNRI